MIYIDVEDVVFHKPSRETWLVAAINHDGTRLSPMGWPEGIADVSDCLLTDKAGIQDRERTISRLAREGKRNDIRTQWNVSRLNRRKARQDDLDVEVLERVTNAGGE